MEEELELPYAPREQFQGFHDRVQRWSIVVAHRRAGKTVACVNDLIRAALDCTRPNPRFAYIAPYFAQAKDVVWSYLKEFTAPIPGTTFNESELRVDLPNGARIRLYGADNYDRLRGIYLDGVVLDEYADMDPRVWPEVIRPALSDREGFAVFIGTPKGRNDFYKLYDDALKKPEWHALMLRASETGIVAAAELADARSMVTPEQYDQEFECSFDAAILGAYYGKDVRQAESDGRVTGVPHDKSADTIASLDLGIGDSTAIWWAQLVGREIHLIDYYEGSGHGLDHYVDVLNSKPYKPKVLILPHDGDARELQTGKSRREFLEGRGFNCNVLANHRVDDGINAARMILNRCWFDKTKTAQGVEALRMYRAAYDEKMKTLKTTPQHDWASHGADAFRYLAMGMDGALPNKKFSREIEYEPQGIY